MLESQRLRWEKKGSFKQVLAVPEGKSPPHSDVLKSQRRDRAEEQYATKTKLESVGNAQREVSPRVGSAIIVPEKHRFGPQRWQPSGTGRPP